MSERMDPEKLTDLMNTCFHRLGKHVMDLDGYIDKFIGDCIMVLFGAPRTHENDPELAVLCATRMRDELRKINEELGLNLGMSFGINSGPVLAGQVGSDGKQDYTAMGDSVNTAQRLQSSAKPGQILVSPSVAHACSKNFHFRPLSPIKVKGKEEPLSVFELTEGERVKDLSRPCADLVGREKEVLIIDRLIQEITASRGQLLLLCGEPGIGKTRLKEEMYRLAKANSISWFESRASALQRETPYYSIVQILSALLGFETTSENKQKRDLIQSQFFSSEVHSKLILELFDLEESGLALTAAQKRPVLFQAIRELVLAHLGSKPMILYLEDIHWIDPLSRDVLDFLMTGLSRLRLGVFASARRDFKHDWGTRENFNQMNLMPLTRADTGRVIANVLEMREAPEDLLDLVFRKTEGNPLFIAEILKSLMDRQMLQKICDSWELISPSSEIEIPGTVQGLIAARIDGLPDSAKRVLQVASVLGRQFSTDILSHMEKFPDLEASLTLLSGKELIVSVESESAGSLYAFHHALIQDVAYQTCLKRELKAYHQRAAEILEATHQDPELFESLAYHYDQAENWTSAVHYHHLTARHRAKNFSNQGAVTAYQRAIKIVESKADQDFPLTALPELYFDLSEVLVRTGRLEEGAEAQRKLLEFAVATDQQSYVTKSYRRLGDIARMRGNASEAIDFLQDALDTARAAKDTEGEIRAIKSLGLAFKLANRLTEAKELLTAGLSRAIELDRPILTAEYLNDLAVILIDLNELDQADAYLRDCIQLAEEHSIKPMYISAHLNRGVISFHRNDLDAALIQFEKSSKVAQSIGDLKNMMSAEHNLGEIQKQHGQLAEALLSFQKSLELSRQIGDQHEEANNLSLIGSTEIQLKRFEEGTRDLDRAIDIAERQNYLAVRMDAYLAKAHYFLETNQIVPALELAQRARVVAESAKSRTFLEKADQLLARIWSQKERA